MHINQSNERMSPNLKVYFNNNKNIFGLFREKEDKTHKFTKFNYYKFLDIKLKL